MFQSKSSRDPEKNAQLVVRQLTNARRRERQRGTPMESQLQAIFRSLIRKRVRMDEDVFREASRRIHDSHERTIRNSTVVERANGRADTIIDLLKKMLDR